MTIYLENIIQYHGLRKSKHGYYRRSIRSGVLDNPVYCGKLAFSRRKNEKHLCGKGI